ncbi:carbohydrate ABC transporter membrane protein 2, CUT1 family [Sanguibacter gelidistatuariae]|uniref:Carbohydrate ABC transporter membrane protein 2, CUT1 family n=1 Tax=Sanguibacter gelidistatuariae TaxID=1814289 RepID=A0A1G6Q6T0_9MICO|nr:carbohydrate ABC transporter permease [Sanguibacter gelidistatuariae]SDC87426.1 carbohydrate ABC transporter membrane protein 2, CUT1 family [Sanguibacter gelidistatuariae]
MTASELQHTVPEVRSAKNRRFDKLARRSRYSGILVYIALGILALVYIYPFLISIANSFKLDPDAAANPISLIPQTFSTEALQRLFEADFPTWFKNSAIVTVVVTSGRVFFNSLAGYALSRLRFPGRGLVFALLIAVMSVPSVVLLIPKFLVINELGMYDTYAGMTIPLLADAAGIFIMKNFFESIPASVEEAARIDGAGVFRRFWSVVLPMARPALVTIFILSFQGSWNEMSHMIISTQSPELFTLTKGVAQLASGALSAGTQYPIKLAAATIMTIPVAVLFFIFQKKIMNSSDGAVKE